MLASDVFRSIEALGAAVEPIDSQGPNRKKRIGHDDGEPLQGVGSQHGLPGGEPGRFSMQARAAEARCWHCR